MNRTWRRVLIGVAVCASLTGAVVGVRAGENMHKIQLNGWVGDLERSHFDDAAHQFFGIGVRDLQAATPQMEATFTYTPVGQDRVKVKGSGQVRVGADRYPFILAPNQSVNIASTPQGQVYVGGLEATVKTRIGDVATSMVLLHRPTTRQSILNLSLGGTEYHMLVGFGQPFMTMEEMQALGKERR